LGTLLGSLPNSNNNNIRGAFQGPQGHLTEHKVIINPLKTRHCGKKQKQNKNKTKQTNNQDGDQLDVVCEFEQVSFEL
jgi:hypothetical protein